MRDATRPWAVQRERSALVFNERVLVETETAAAAARSSGCARGSGIGHGGGGGAGWVTSHNRGPDLLAPASAHVQGLRKTRAARVAKEVAYAKLDGHHAGRDDADQLPRPLLRGCHMHIRVGVARSAQREHHGRRVPGAREVIVPEGECILGVHRAATDEQGKREPHIVLQLANASVGFFLTRGSALNVPLL